MTTTRQLAMQQTRWPVGVAALVAAAPILGAIASASIELSQWGESPMWIVAGGCFLVSPGIAAVAADRTGDPWLLRVAIGTLLAGVLFAIWIVNVPVPTHPGVYVGGSSRLSGAIMSVLTALAWYVASGRALWWMRRGHQLIGYAIGGVILTGLAAVAFVLGSFI